MDHPEIRRHVIAHFHTIILRRMLREKQGYYLQACQFVGDDEEARLYFVEVCLEMQAKIRPGSLLASGILILLIVFSIPLIEETARAQVGRLRLARSLRVNHGRFG